MINGLDPKYVIGILKRLLASRKWFPRSRKKAKERTQRNSRNLAALIGPVETPNEAFVVH